MVTGFGLYYFDRFMCLVFFGLEMKCMHPTPPYYRILVRSSLPLCVGDGPRHYSKQGPVAPSFYYLLSFELLFIGLVPFFVNIINFGFLPSCRVWDGFREIKTGERIGPRGEPH